MAGWRRWSAHVALAGMLLTAGCQQAAEKEGLHDEPAESGVSSEAVGGLSDNRAARPAAKAQEPGAPPPPPGEVARDRQGTKAPQSSTTNRYIIRRGSVTLQVNQVPEAMDAVGVVARRHGGFVSDSNIQITEGVPPSATLTVRVPSARFDSVMNELKGVGTVRARAINSEDVSVEFVDTQSRIRNLQKEEATILNLLDRTGKLSEILEVERELSRVRGEIEQAQGRIRQLSALVDLATIEVSLAEQVQASSTSPWQLPTVVQNAWHNAQRELAEAVGTLVTGTIWLVGYVLPLLIPAALIFLVVGWGLRSLLVDRLKLLPLAWFYRLWGAAAVVIACLVAPPILAVVLLLGGVVFLAWAGSALWGRFARGMREEA